MSFQTRTAQHNAPTRTAVGLAGLVLRQMRRQGAGDAGLASLGA